MPRHTLAEPFACEGVAIHSGAPVKLVAKPAGPGDGISFARVDLAPAPAIPARLEAVSGASFATSLAAPGSPAASVSTVEHLLAALATSGVDDTRIELDGPEVPVCDGSAAPFAELISKAGLTHRDAPRREIVIRESIEIEIEAGDRRIAVHPSDAFGVDVAIDFDHPAIGRQRIACGEVTPEWFAREIAPARTFGFIADVDALRARGLACGASHDNTVVFDEEGVMNEAGLRFPDEPVRHKALDLLGDLALLGAALRGQVIVEKGGHGLHHRLVAAILDAPSAWTWQDPIADRI